MSFENCLQLSMTPDNPEGSADDGTRLHSDGRCIENWRPMLQLRRESLRWRALRGRAGAAAGGRREAFLQRLASVSLNKISVFLFFAF